MPICFKAPPKHDARFPHPAKDFYIQCSSLFVVDLDKDTELSRQALTAVGTNCNCVAATPRGVHLYFAGAIPDLRGKQLDGLDVRTGDGNGDNKQPDIIFCAPSWYATPAGDAKYEWIVLPQAAANLLPPRRRSLIFSVRNPASNRLQVLLALRRQQPLQRRLSNRYRPPCVISSSRKCSSQRSGRKVNN